MIEAVAGRRQAAVLRALPAAQVDALLVSSLPNIRYLTGFSGSAALLLLAPDRQVLFTDFRYATQAPAEVGAAARVAVERANLWDGLRREIESHLIARLGVERERMTLRDAERLSRIRGTSVVPCGPLVEVERVRKDDQEVAAIREAARLALDALESVVPMIRPGLTELEVAAELEAALRRRGSEWHPFQTIVVSGPRSALPHGHSTRRVIEPGDWLLIDFGAELDGYCADLTRTFVVGARATERQREIYYAVRDAQAAAKIGIRAGMTGREADALAREPLAARGLGEAFGHSLGHGLGLEVHEDPRVSQMNEGALPAGAVVTIEPGVYLEGWGGVRIEDDVWLGPAKTVCLSESSTELVEII
jgi:Xaa-Pro aminopeptidase